MTDLEILRKCAEKMEIDISCSRMIDGDLVILCDSYSSYAYLVYNPFNDDMQAMALVKRFLLYVAPDSGGWDVGPENTTGRSVINKDLNRAIVECVSKLP